jgi:hypothetical protein
MKDKSKFSLTKKSFVYVVLVIFLLSFITTAQASSGSDLPKVQNYDLVVYGGSPAGVMAAIAAKREGLNVVLIAQGKTVGGSLSNGLGATDLTQTDILTALPLEFFKAVQASYHNSDTLRVTPKRAEDIFRKMLRNAKVDFYLNVPITEATVTNNSITCLIGASQDNWCAKEFIDASYMGDLLPLTNTAFHLGREDFYSYGDYKDLNYAFRVRLTLPPNLTQVEKDSLGSLPFMQHPTSLETGSVKFTSGMPSFTYRFCITTGKKQRPFRIYDEDLKYIPAWKVIAKAFYKKGCPDCENTADRKITRFWRIAKVAGNKWDLNSLNSFTNFPMPEDYFTDPSTQAGYNLQAAHYVESLMAYLQGPAGPIKTEKIASAGFGVCSDEFVDNDNIPYEPYIREGRRIVGQSTLLASDELTGAAQPDSIGLAKYPLDNKMSISIQFGTRLFRDFTNFVNSRVYEVPFSITVPKNGLSNLLVPIAVSTSPLAYGSMRMEPHYMSLGQATGIGAALAIKDQVPVQRIPIKKLQDVLVSWGQKLHQSWAEKHYGN